MKKRKGWLTRDKTRLEAGGERRASASHSVAFPPLLNASSARDGHSLSLP